MDSVILKPRTAAINSSRDMIVVANGATFVLGATNIFGDCSAFVHRSRGCLVRHPQMCVTSVTTFLLLVLSADIVEL